jgi:release factor glutamine methyltransferase
MKYNIQNQDIELELNEKVFSPSPHGSSALGNSIKINKGESVLDVGTGTGLLAILASKLGAKTTAVDIMPEAAELAGINSRKNKVLVDVRIGDLFVPVEGNNYDVIIANVPQENLSPKVIKSVSDETVVGMHGGKNGNELLLRVLNEAPQYMHENSRLYVVVYSMSNFRESLKEILNKYKANLINFHTGQVKDFVYIDEKWYEKQSADGFIEIYKKDNKYFADLFVFELTLK